MSKYIGQNVAVASIKSTAEGRALLEAETVAAQRVLLDTNSVSEVDAKDALRVNLADETYYQQDNILGIVSQTAGVPTGAIIERGSNANGEFVKYADGTLICTFYKVDLAVALTLSNGVYYNSLVWTFPSTFIATPSIASAGFVSGILSWASADGQASSATVGYVSVFANVAATADVYFIPMAIGRWW